MSDYFLLPFPEFFDRLRQFAQAERPIYLVGGAVRDLLLKRPTHDLDFVMAGDIKPVARHLANLFNGAFYMLDDERNTARIICSDAEGKSYVMDFATLRAGSLEDDLRARDFTINAMALDVENPQKIIDPVGGAVDLHEGRLRMCSPSSLQDDSIRVVRGVRLATSFTQKILPETYQAMRQAAPLLVRVSPERQRDELFRIFEGRRVSTAIRLLDQVGALDYLLPGINQLKGVSQSPPHVLDVWEHTLVILQELENLLAVLTGSFNEEAASNLLLGLTVLNLGDYRQLLTDYFNLPITADRSPRSLLYLAAIYHDIGKKEVMDIAQSRAHDSGERIRFINHEAVGAEMMTLQARNLALSNLETQYLTSIVRHHMRIHSLTATRKAVSRRAIYRFFRDTGTAGVGICILSLADMRATSRSMLAQEDWIAELEVCRELFDAWWKKPAEVVDPPRLLSGNDLMDLFKLSPGPKIGELLEALHEAQAAGEVTTREDALRFIQIHIQEK